MSRRWFIVFLVALALVGTSILTRQQMEIKEAKQTLAAITNHHKSNDARFPNVPAPKKSPSAELLKLRNEVTLLRRELDGLKHQSPPPSQKDMADEWREVHSGPKPSDQPDFVFMSKLEPTAQATAAQAFQMFQYAMRRQDKEPLTPIKMKEIWDVPDDFDDPQARYSIGMGEGIGGEIGYRIAREQTTSSNEVRLTVELEKSDGSSSRQERTVVRRNGKWRLKPDSVSRAE